MFVYVNDLDDSDSSDWDCVDDYQSENGQLVDFARWQEDDILLTGLVIRSPVNTPTVTNEPTVHDGNDDSEDSDGISTSYSSYHYDKEEEDERRYFSFDFDSYLLPFRCLCQ